ncbi:NHLP bacteriocin export ABC transporter permease/ATPase subunit [Lignipirellula cremea]|uniref:Toxin RTX-I translocation ATP-binding protein n=1 Tax=Lignipirellula cremea TaxID=2528010 RepID=A0A518DQN1_9BACT|nr:NHLP bacteriocin export ABC transporter permease/ATPase subunit [Lignipirellula cremea]QDU94146.1 Toxin RTX-I translocation ATP-binding protein [Lignipirellula cremea]
MAFWQQLFESEGETREVAGNHPLDLRDPSLVWMIAAGRIDLFAMATDEETAPGPRLHLGQFAPGDMLFSGTGLLAVGTPDTQVLGLPLSRLQEVLGGKGSAAETPSEDTPSEQTLPDATSPEDAATASDTPAASDALAASDAPAEAAPPVSAVEPPSLEERGKEFAALIDLWIERLTQGVVRSYVPRKYVTLNADLETRLKADCVVSPVATVWIPGSEHDWTYLDDYALSIRDPQQSFPVADCAWLHTSERAIVTAVSTPNLLQEPRFWPGLDHFHQVILECAARKVASEQAADLRRLRRKSIAEKEQELAALTSLASAAHTESVAEAQAPSEDPLLAACRVIGHRMNFEVATPRSLSKNQVADPVAAIARASSVRHREVALKGQWWKEENGPLLGFRSSDEAPVALLPKGKGYEIFDPKTGQSTSMTAAGRSKLQGRAYMFYRSLPSRKMTPGDIFLCSLPGTGMDWLRVVLLGLAGAVLSLFVPIATGTIVGEIIPSSNKLQLAIFVLALVINTFVVSVFEYCQSIAVLRLETRMDASMEGGVWDRLLNLPASFFRQYSTGDLAMRAMGIGQIRQMFTEAAMTSVLNFVFSFVAFALLFYYDVRLALVATGAFLLVMIATAFTVWLQLPYERRHYEAQGRVASIVFQLLGGISRLRVAGAETRALAYWARNYSEQIRLSFRGQWIANNLGTFNSAIPLLASLAIFAAVAALPRDQVSLSTFLAFSAAFASIMGAATSMSGTITSILDVVPLYERCRPILETPPEFHLAKREPGQLSGRIEVGHVSFSYDKDGPRVLEDVSIEVQPGEFVAFVGPSGSGKSTILRLLLGFEKPDTGSVYYDREDLAQLDQQAVRRQIGVVLQNGKIGSGSIFRAIIGSAPLTLDDAWEAARLSGLDKDIEGMPMGMHTVISEGESTLSGGQRQRLMIARAIVNRPKILLFDEATSALDNVTQEIVSQSLERLKATRIVVAHRLSTIVNADRIFVIQQGKVIQEGNFQDLLNQPGLFAELAKRQLA